MAEMSFGQVSLDVPVEFIDRYCTCYLKQCVLGVGLIRGILIGFKTIKGQDLVQFEAEDGHDFFVPMNNISYYELIDPELLEKSQKARENEVLKSRQDDEDRIRDEIATRMQTVEEQFQNANQSESAGDPPREEEGDSDFVFKL